MQFVSAIPTSSVHVAISLSKFAAGPSKAQCHCSSVFFTITLLRGRSEAKPGKISQIWKNILRT